MSLRTNLVSYYELNETSGTTAADSQGSNTGTYEGDLPTAVSGIQGNAQDFDGTGDYISMGDVTALSATDISISGWINLDALPSNDTTYTIASKYDANSAGREWNFEINTSNDKMRFFYYDSSDNLTRGECDTAFVAGDVSSWKHVAVTVDVSAQTITFYINGEAQSTTLLNSNATSMRDGDDDLKIGARESTATNFLDGQMDEFAFYNSIISAQQVKELYNNVIGRDYATTEFDGTNWDGYDEYTSDNTKVANANDNLMIDLGVHASAGFWSAVESDGKDIRLVNSAGDLAYPTELENFDSTAETGIVYFHSLGLETGSDTTYRLYAGNTGATAPAEGDPLGKHAVYNPDYEGVYHMDEASGNLVDSTRNSDSATANGNPTYGVTGALGDAIDFDGTGDYFNGLKDYGTAIGTGDLTVQGFFKIANQNSRRTIISFGESDFSEYFTIRAGQDTDSNDIALISRESSPGQVTISSTGFQDNAYHLFHATRSGTTGTFYLDGTQQNQTTDAEWGTSLGNDTSIGSFFSGTDDLDGTLDEIRILSAELSANWITTEYNNQSDNTNFWSVTGNFATRRIFNIS